MAPKMLTLRMVPAYPRAAVAERPSGFPRSPAEGRTEKPVEAVIDPAVTGQKVGGILDAPHASLIADSAMSPIWLPWKGRRRWRSTPPRCRSLP